MNNSKIEALASEIQRHGEMVSLATIDMIGGCHISEHVGLTNEQLVMRQKDRGGKVCSTFDDENAVNICLSDYFEFPYTAKKLAKWVLDYSAETRLEERGFIDESNPIGRMIKKNGAILKVSGYCIVLQKVDVDYRNPHTGLPFDIVTMFCEE